MKTIDAVLRLAAMALVATACLVHIQRPVAADSPEEDERARTLRLEERLAAMARDLEPTGRVERGGATFSIVRLPSDSGTRLVLLAASNGGEPIEVAIGGTLGRSNASPMSRVPAPTLIGRLPVFTARLAPGEEGAWDLPIEAAAYDGATDETRAWPLRRVVITLDGEALLAHDEFAAGLVEGAVEAGSDS